MCCVSAQGASTRHTHATRVLVPCPSWGLGPGPWAAWWRGHVLLGREGFGWLATSPPLCIVMGRRLVWPVPSPPSRPSELGARPPLWVVLPPPSCCSGLCCSLGHGEDWQETGRCLRAEVGGCWSVVTPGFFSVSHFDLLLFSGKLVRTSRALGSLAMGSSLRAEGWQSGLRGMWMWWLRSRCRRPRPSLHLLQGPPHKTGSDRGVSSASPDSSPDR